MVGDGAYGLGPPSARALPPTLERGVAVQAYRPAEGRRTTGHDLDGRLAPRRFWL